MAQALLQANEEIAEKNRKLFNAKKLLTVNLISAPGAGKTTLLEKTIARLKEDLTIGVVEGDIYTTRDAERIAGQGVDVVQINTSGACHLDANMIASALEELSLKDLDLLIIENVGNLVCPAEFDLGEDCKVAVFSVTEGSDKPAKYPLVFSEAQAVVINKTDLLSYTDFDMDMVVKELTSINNNIKLFNVSAKNGEGLEAWCAWLKDLVRQKRQVS
jgi:hydrogenase nickel incorporation protein HypB